jgi:hypothetical protein
MGLVEYSVWIDAAPDRVGGLYRSRADPGVEQEAALRGGLARQGHRRGSEDPRRGTGGFVFCAAVSASNPNPCSDAPVTAANWSNAEFEMPRFVAADFPKSSNAFCAPDDADRNTASIAPADCSSAAATKSRLRHTAYRPGVAAPDAACRRREVRISSAGSIARPAAMSTAYRSRSCTLCHDVDGSDLDGGVARAVFGPLQVTDLWRPTGRGNQCLWMRF